MIIPFSVVIVPRFFPTIFFPLSKKSTVVQKSTAVILAELVPIGDAAPQALRGLRGGWCAPRRRLLAAHAVAGRAAASRAASSPTVASSSAAD